MRIFRIELRRSIAPWAGLVVVAVALGLLLPLTGPWWNPPSQWHAQTTTTAMWLRYMMVFLWPIAVGVGALQGMRDSRSGATELLSTVPRPAWQRMARLAGAVGLLAAVGFVLSFVAGVVEVVAHDGFLSWTFVPVIAIGALAMVAGTSVGLAVGRLLPHPLTAPALSVVAMALSMVSFSSLGQDESSLLSVRAALLGTPALPNPFGNFVTTTAAVDLGQAIWFAGLIATGFLLLAARSVRAKLLGVAPMVMAAVVALLVLPATAENILTVDTVAAQQVCDGPVCVSRLHQAVLPTLSAAARDALSKLAVLPNAPTRVRERTQTDEPNSVPFRDPDVVYVDFQYGPKLLKAGPDELSKALLDGAGTPTCGWRNFADRPATPARMISLAYFTGTVSAPLGEPVVLISQDLDTVQPLWATFHALPADVQRSRISAMRQVFLTCKGNPLNALLPGAAR